MAFLTVTERVGDTSAAVGAKVSAAIALFVVAERELRDQLIRCLVRPYLTAGFPLEGYNT